MNTDQAAAERKHPNYEFHIPAAFSYPLQVGLTSLTLGILIFFLFNQKPVLAGTLGACLILVGAGYVAVCIALRRITNLERRLQGREQLLDEIPWRGDETFLDVGCGNGILTHGAARRLTTGKGIGIDIWTEGSGDNFPEIFLENAEIEGVVERVSLQNEDVRHLPYDDCSFDVILSGLTMHHMKFETSQAMAEMVRVLKPGGWIAIYDEPSTIMYCTKLMEKNGLQVKKKRMDMVLGTK